MWPGCGTPLMPGGLVPNGPPGVSRPIESTAGLVNHRLLSGPTVMLAPGPLPGAGMGEYSAVTAPDAGLTLPISLAALSTTYMSPSGPSTRSEGPPVRVNSVTAALDVAELG